jgi:hypothetical protein
MAEYYTVLRRAIAGIDPNVPETRRAVYDKARNALIGQLKAVDPPLTTAEISRQRLELEEAIRRVERETAAGIGGAAAARPRPAANRPAPPPRHVEPEPAGMPPAHEYDPPASPSPQEVFRRAVQESTMRGETDRTTPAPVARYDAAPPELRGTAPRGERSPPPPRGEAGERGAFPVRGDAPRYAPPEYRRRAQQQPPPPPADDHYQATPHDEEPYDNEPRLAPEYDQEWQDHEQQQPPPPPTPQVDRRERAAAGGRGRGYDEPAKERAAPTGDKPRRSRIGGILVAILIVAIIGGVGAFAWSQRAMINDLIAGLESGEAPATAPEQPLLPPTPDDPSATASADSGKNTDRLLPGEPAPPGSDVRVVGNGETADAGPTAPAEPIPASAPPTEDTGVPAAGQKAILYEEPVDGAGADATVTSVNAAVTWKFVGDGPNGPEVEANLEVPDRNMTIKFSLHKNADDTLPASHLVEVVVDTPADFPGKSIGSIPRIVLKPTEGARGQPLVGAAAKVADGFFWIALSAADNDIAANLSLIRERNWIDLPFVYENGQRAILTFEKGPDGEAAFQQAFAAWGAT